MTSTREETAETAGRAAAIDAEDGHAAKALIDAEGADREAGLPARAAAPVAPWLVTTAGYAWRLLVVGAALLALGWVAYRLRMVFMPLFVALLGTALLRPAVLWMRRRGVPAAAAAAAAVAAALAAFGAILVAIVPPFVAQADELMRSLAAGVDTVGDWLLDGPVDLSQSELDELHQRVVTSLRDNSDVLADQALTGAQVAFETLVVLALSVVVTFFFLKDGERLWSAVSRLAPAGRRADVDELGRRLWVTLAGYLRGVTVVALFDAIFIGLALVLIGVPAALPLAVITFFGAYVPIVGAFVTGIAAVLVALVADGLLVAGLVAAAVILVQQLESNVLQPVVVGRAVAIHPVVILLSVTAGGILAGVLGALVAVPIAAGAARIGGFAIERSRRVAEPHDR